MDRTTFISDMKTEAINGYSYYQGYIKEMLNAYLLRMDPAQYNWLEKRAKSRLYFPKMNAKGKRIADSLSETYFNNDTFAKLGEYINTDPIVIEKWQKAIDHYTEMVNLYKVFQPIFLKAPYMPLSIAKVYWADDLAQIDEINIDDFYVDPRAESAGDVRYVVNRIRMTKGDMLKLQKDGIYKKSVNIKNLIQETIPFERFEVFDVYYQTPNGWELSTIYNDSVILRDKLKLKDGQPFVFGYMLPQVKDLNEYTYVASYGEAPLASMLPLQEEFNTTRNSIIDAMKQHLAPKVVMPKTAGVSRVDLETPSKPIFTASPTGVTIMPPPNIQSAQLNLQMIDNDASEVSGISPQNNGISPTRKETATQSSIMANEGSVRIQGYVRTFNETFFEPIFERLAMLVWQHGDDSFFYGIDRKHLPSFKVVLNTGIGALNKEVQKQGLMQAHQMVGGQMQAYMALQDTAGAKRMLNASEKIVRDMLPLFGIKNIDDYIGKEEDTLQGENNDINTRPEIASGLNPESSIQQGATGAIQPPSIH